MSQEYVAVGQVGLPIPKYAMKNNKHQCQYRKCNSYIVDISKECDVVVILLILGRRIIIQEFR